MSHKELKDGFDQILSDLVARAKSASIDRDWIEKELENIAEWRARFAVMHDVLCEAGLNPGVKSTETVQAPLRQQNGVWLPRKPPKTVIKVRGAEFKMPNADGKKRSIEFLQKTGRAKSMPKNYTPAGGGYVQIKADVFYAKILPLLAGMLKKGK